LGAHTITVTATDAAGNSASCTTSFTVLVPRPRLLSVRRCRCQRGCELPGGGSDRRRQRERQLLCSKRVTITQSPRRGPGRPGNALDHRHRDQARATARAATNTVTDTGAVVARRCPAPARMRTARRRFRLSRPAPAQLLCRRRTTVNHPRQGPWSAGAHDTSPRRCRR
jgi:hypothetical protein